MKIYWQLSWMAWYLAVVELQSQAKMCDFWQFQQIFSDFFPLDLSLSVHLFVHL